MKRLTKAIATGVAALLSVPNAHPETRSPEFGISSLEAVCVQIEAYAGIPIEGWQSELQQTVTKRLAKSGVPIADSAEACYGNPKNAVVFFSLHGARSRSGKLVGYHVGVAILEQGRLLRAPNLQLGSVTTWDNWQSGLCETNDLERELRRSVVNLVDLFASLYKDEKARASSKPSNTTMQRTGRGAARR